MKIVNATVVTFDYTMKDGQGNVLGTTDGAEPVTYLRGVQMIIPGLESALEGREAGDTVSVRLEPEQAYGSREEALIQAVPRELFGSERPQLGERYQAEGPDGESLEVTVIAVEDDEVVLDANHPLAGVALQLQVSVLQVREPTRKELNRGRAFPRATAGL